MKKLSSTLVLSSLLLISCSEQNNYDESMIDAEAEKKVEEFRSEIKEPFNCNEFELDFKRVNEHVNPILKTNLPDAFRVNISISRSYWEKDNEYDSEYPLSYYNETKTIGEWKKGQWITIIDQEWINSLILRQEEGEQTDMPFTINRISDSIFISASIFSEKSEYNLVNGTPSNVELKYKSKLDLPIKKSSSGAKVLIQHNNLKVGAKYVVSEKIPLMPALNPNDPIAGIEKMKDVFPNEIIKVVKRSHKGNPNNPWYQVSILDADNNSIKTGWINSIALMGKEVKQF